MTAALGAIACVGIAAFAIGFGATLTAWMAGLQRAYPPKYFPLVTFGYLAGLLACVVVVGECLGWWVRARPKFSRRANEH
jgi:hypothetical protein